MIKKIIFQTLKALFWVLIIFHIFLVLISLAGSLYLIKHTPQDFSLKTYRGNIGKTHTMRPLGEVPLPMREMLIFVEDTRFYRHNGIDLRSINMALDLNQSLGYKAYGGSTITQQLARTLFLTPSKNYIRKYAEIIIALIMDGILSKERILELYFNCVEWGPGLYGLFDAVKENYNCAPSALPLDSQVRLITILPNPLEYTVRNFSGDDVMQERYLYLISFVKKRKYPGFSGKMEVKKIGANESAGIEEE